MGLPMDVLVESSVRACSARFWIYKRRRIGNCNYILFTKLPWPRDSEGTVRSSSQAATCQPIYHTRRRLHTVPLIAERYAGKLRIPMFIVFGLTRPEIKPASTALVADALSTRPMIGSLMVVHKLYTPARGILIQKSIGGHKSVNR